MYIPISRPKCWAKRVRGVPVDRVVWALSMHMSIINAQILGCEEIVTPILEQRSMTAQGVLSIKVCTTSRKWLFMACSDWLSYCNNLWILTTCFSLKIWHYMLHKWLPYFDIIINSLFFFLCHKNIILLKYMSWKNPKKTENSFKIANWKKKNKWLNARQGCQSLQHKVYQCFTRL